MLTHEEMVGLQAEKHNLIDVNDFKSREEYVLHLIHSFAYVQASALTREKRVLDLGCNTGYGTEILSTSADKVVGVDVSSKAIAIAKTRHGHSGIEFHLIDGKKLPFDDHAFDVIISCQVIEHIVDYSIYLNEIQRVLSPTGIVLLTTPNALLRLDPGMKPWNKFHVREFKHSDLQELLKSHFAYVQIIGLHAQESTYLVEKNRLTRAREAAREEARALRPRSHYHLLRSMARKLIPAGIIQALKKTPPPTPLPQAYTQTDTSFTDQHSLEDFHYRTDKLDSALDLLALCTNDGSIMTKVEHNLKIVQ